jgi:16S rRNA (uracil1498-N3)-methyltransferase
VNLFYQPLIPEGHLSLDAEESKHCVRVLRRKQGDHIHITDGKGYFYEAEIINASPAECSFKILEKKREALKTYSIHIAVSPTKNNDRIEWFVEKAVEFGVDKITLIECEHTERAFIKADRLMKVAISAMKQSLKASVPIIEGVKKIKEVLVDNQAEQKFMGYVDRQNPDHLKTIASPSKTYLILIGPEGDFSPEELNLALQNGFRKVSLGASRLRTETAALASCHILNLINS